MEKGEGKGEAVACRAEDRRLPSVRLADLRHVRHTVCHVVAFLQPLWHYCWVLSSLLLTMQVKSSCMQQQDLIWQSVKSGIECCFHGIALSTCTRRGYLPPACVQARRHAPTPATEHTAAHSTSTDAGPPCATHATPPQAPAGRKTSSLAGRQAGWLTGWLAGKQQARSVDEGSVLRRCVRTFAGALRSAAVRRLAARRGRCRRAARKRRRRERLRNNSGEGEGRRTCMLLLSSLPPTRMRDVCASLPMARPTPPPAPAQVPRRGGCVGAATRRGRSAPRMHARRCDRGGAPRIRCQWWPPIRHRDSECALPPLPQPEPRHWRRKSPPAVRLARTARLPLPARGAGRDRTPVNTCAERRGSVGRRCAGSGAGVAARKPPRCKRPRQPRWSTGFRSRPADGLPTSPLKRARAPSAAV
eukprot:56164-Chlamydomonas_euryale.AAC.3